MSFDNVKKVINNCADMCSTLGKNPHFSITGGDPILHPDFWEICEYLHGKSIGFSLMGNPFHLTAEKSERLKNLGCENYQMSIDGMQETHDKIRKPGSFAATLERIPMLQTAGISVTIMMTVSKMNADEIEDIIDLVVANKVNVFAFARYCNNSGKKGVSFTPQEYRTVLDRCYKKFVEHGDSATRFSLKDHLWTLYLREIGEFEPDADADIDIEKDIIYDGCGCGFMHMTILPNGDVFACRRCDSKVGNALSENMCDIFLGENLERYRTLENFEKCRDCELLNFCRGCPAVACSETGNFFAPDPQCWK